MYEAYRVRRRFQWRGWEYAPKGQCDCSKQEAGDGNPCIEAGCTGQVGTGCTACPDNVCRCACNIPAWRYGGDIWIVEAGHPRKDMILGNRFVVGDASLPAVDELLNQDEYSRLLSEPPKPVREVKKKPAPSNRKRPVAVKSP